MSDDLLDKIMRTGKQVPEPTSEAREEAWKAARKAFREANKESGYETTPIRPGKGNLLRWGVWGGIAAVFCLGIFWAGQGGMFSLVDPIADEMSEGPGVMVVEDADSVDAPVSEEKESAYRLLEEMRTQFDDQFLAMIEGKDGISILTGTKGAHFSTQPVLLQIYGPTHTTRILTFSGQRLQAKIDQYSLNLEVLITGEGEVMVLGQILEEENSLTDDETIDYQIEAITL